jgi:hypothetical protein
LAVECVAAYPIPAPPASATAATPATATGRADRQRCQRGGFIVIMSVSKSSSGPKPSSSGSS